MKPNIDTMAVESRKWLDVIHISESIKNINIINKFNKYKNG